jgi:pyruvate formate lyase activating enzyme
MKEAAFYEMHEDVIKCLLCPHYCVIKPGKKGSCRVRANEGDKLISEIYGKASAVHFDPIEKKPLYHFHPGSVIFSIGSIGCNLHCKFCQNSDISQTGTEGFPYLRDLDPEDVIVLATQRNDNIGMAYTYNEPIVWYEYMTDIAVLAKESHLKNVMVSNGFINPAPLETLLPLMDAFSIDLKAFTEDFYSRITLAALEPVKETLKMIRKAGKHLEITNLVIPTLNDDPGKFEEMAGWIAEELGKETVLHLSRYFPTYKMTIESTPPDTLLNLHRIARRYLDYVFIGNASLKEGRDTVCSRCGHVAISRIGYQINAGGLDRHGKCVNCGNLIATM